MVLFTGCAKTSFLRRFVGRRQSAAAGSRMAPCRCDFSRATGGGSAPSAGETPRSQPGSSEVSSIGCPFFPHKRACPKCALSQSLLAAVICTTVGGCGGEAKSWPGPVIAPPPLALWAHECCSGQHALETPKQKPGRPAPRILQPAVVHVG